jgi:hypothetical protein
VKNILKYLFVVLVLALTMSSRANAKGWWWDHPKTPPPTHDGWTAPEVDPSLAMGGLTLLAGSLTVLRSRRRK